MKKVFITGGAGFIGRHLSELFLIKKYKVVILDNLSTGNINNINFLKKTFPGKIKFVKADILKYQNFNQLVKNSYFVIHLAAAVGVQNILDNPVQSINLNIHGAQRVLDACVKYNKKIFISSTSEVYGKQKNTKLIETDDVVFGNSTKIRWSYATCKLLDEFIALSYHNDFKLKVVIGRLFNTVGPFQSSAYGMVIPRLIKQAISNEDMTVHGTGKQTRTFTDVNEVCHCIYKLMHNKNAIGQVVNIGASQETSILNLANKIKTLSKSSSKIKIIPYSKAYSNIYEDMQKRSPSNRKLKKIIGFRPQLDIQTILMKILNKQYQK